MILILECMNEKLFIYLHASVVLHLLREGEREERRRCIIRGRDGLGRVEQEDAGEITSMTRRI